MPESINKLVIYAAVGLLLIGGIWAGIRGPAEPEPIQLGANTDYYVSNFGSDSNDGLASTTAWASLAKVNAATLAEGDTVYFRCGDVWRSGRLNPDESGVSGNPITFTNYGDCVENNLPLITGSYDYGSTTAVWTDEGGNIWHSANGTSPQGPGTLFAWDGLDYSASAITPIIQESSEGALNTQGEFWYDGANQRVKVYSVGNPATVYDVLEFPFSSYNSPMTTGSSVEYITIDGLAIAFAGQHCAGGGASNMIWQNNKIFGCGGINPYAGNGWQISGSASNILFDSNEVYHIFDSCVTPQNWDPGDVIEDVIISNNHLHDCAAGIEFLTFSEATDAVIIRDITIENNTIWCSENGEPYALEYNQVGDAGIHSLTQERATTTNIRVIGNIIRGCSAGPDDNDNGNGVRILTTNYSQTYSTYSSNWYFEGNMFYDNENSAIAFECSGCPGNPQVNSTSAEFINNFFYNNGEREVRVYAYQDWPGLRFYNNTFVDTTGDTNVLIDGQNSDIVHWNNIFQGNLSTAATSTNAGTWTGSNNIRYSTSSQFVTAIGFPNFIDATSTAALDFRIQVDSPAIDAGNNSYHPTSTDYYGNTVFNSTWDIGAYEYQGGIGAPHHLTYGTSPASSVQAAATWNTFTVRIEASDNTLISTSTAEIVLSKASGSGSLGGDLNVNAVNGIATFSDITFDTAGSITIDLDSTGLTGISGTSITVTAAPVVGGGASTTIQGGANLQGGANIQ